MADLDRTNVRCDSPPCRYWSSYAGRQHFAGFHGECRWHSLVEQPPFGAVCRDIHLVGRPLENCPAHVAMEGGGVVKERKA